MEITEPINETILLHLVGAIIRKISTQTIRCRNRNKQRTYLKADKTILSFCFELLGGYKETLNFNAESSKKLTDYRICNIIVTNTLSL